MNPRPGTPSEPSESESILAQQIAQALQLQVQDLRSQLAIREQAMEVAGETFWEWNIVTGSMSHDRYRALMLGYEPHEVPADLNTWIDWSHPEDRQQVEQKLTDHLQGITPFYEAEYRQQHKQGHWVWVRSRGKVIERSPRSGTALRMVGTAIEITRRRELEERVNRLNQDLLALLMSLPDAVAQKNIHGEWLFGNHAANQLFGPLGLGFETATALTPELDELRARGREADEEAWLGRGVRISLETYAVRGQDREFEVQRMPIFDAQGRRKMLVMIARDLWKQREQEQELRLALGKAEEAARSKAQFLATMAHEIRTPLNSIIGATQLAMMDEHPEHLAEPLQMVHTASQQLLDLVNSVLDFSRIESGELPVEVAPISIKQLLHRISIQFGPQVQAKGLNWHVTIDPDLPPALLGDGLRLQQVIANLVGNALKFTEVGEISVEARKVLDESGRPRVQIDVWDTGLGMTPDQQERIFEAFRQADPTMARRFGGTGLGLTISRHLMELMGGELSVKSRLREGSCFSLRWPMEMLSVPVREPTQPLPTHRTRTPAPLDPQDVAQQIVAMGRPLQGRHVLVVDDNRMNIVVVRRFLERAGLKVSTVGSGADALEFLQTQPALTVDAVLMDLYMPEMTGADCTRLIRSELGLTSLPILALSASVTQEERDLCASAGMNDFIAKPVEPLLLLSRLRAAWPDLKSAS